MAGNTFGHILKLTTFGESHGVAIGGIIDGFPSGISIDMQQLQNQLDRRRPGQSILTTSRNESDQLELLSGIFDGKSLGTPIGFLIRNRDHQSADYSQIKEVYRPSHADFTFDQKFGIRDYRGGGRSSARETVSRVVAGAFAQQWLESLGVKVWAYVHAVGEIEMPEDYASYSPEMVDLNDVRCPDAITADKMKKEILNCQKNKDSIGGQIKCVITGVPSGIGSPVFDKLQAELAKAMMSINAVKAFEYGLGFDASRISGSKSNDSFIKEGEQILPKTNRSGGIQGGISNGADIYMKIAFKAVATIMQDQHTLNGKGEAVLLKAKGRHDVCVLPRAVPIVEAMAALVIADQILLQRTTKGMTL